MRSMSTTTRYANSAGCFIFITRERERERERESERGERDTKPSPKHLVTVHPAVYSVSVSQLLASIPSFILLLPPSSSCRHCCTSLSCPRTDFLFPTLSLAGYPWRALARVPVLSLYPPPPPWHANQRAGAAFALCAPGRRYIKAF